MSTLLRGWLRGTGYQISVIRGHSPLSPGPHPPFLICHYWPLYATIRTIRDYSHCSHYLLFAIRYTLFETTSYLLLGFYRHPLISGQYVNLKNFYEISSKWSSDIGSRKYAEIFSKYFYFDKKITYALVHFRAYFSETNRKIVKARLTLVAYLVLIHIVQFFCCCCFLFSLCVIMRSRVI